MAVFVRCFADSKGIERELIKNYTEKFPRGVLASVSVMFSLFSNKNKLDSKPEYDYMDES